MSKYVFEFQTSFQSLYTFNLLNIRYFKFDDDKYELLLNFGDYDHYSIDPSTYHSLKENLIKLSENLNCIFDEGRYIFLNHIDGLCVNKRGYFVMFKMTDRFYTISKQSYYEILEKFKE